MSPAWRFREGTLPPDCGTDTTPRSYDWSLSCMMCGRATEFRKTEAEVAAMPPSKCTSCGGRMLLSRADLGQRGGVFDPSIPTEIKTKVNHYRSKLGSA